RSQRIAHQHFCDTFPRCIHGVHYHHSEFAGILQGKIRLAAVNRHILLPIWCIGINSVLTREGFTMSNALQYGIRQDTANRLQPCAGLQTPTRTQLLRPGYEHPALAQLSAAAVELLDTYGRVKVCQKNTVLIYAGTPSPACYVVL